MVAVRIRITSISVSYMLRNALPTDGRAELLIVRTVLVPYCQDLVRTVWGRCTVWAVRDAAILIV